MDRNFTGIEYSFIYTGSESDSTGEEIASEYMREIHESLDYESRRGSEQDRDDCLEQFGNYWNALEKAYDEEAEYNTGYDSITEISEAITPKLTPATQALDGENNAGV